MTLLNRLHNPPWDRTDIRNFKLEISEFIEDPYDANQPYIVTGESPYDPKFFQGFILSGPLVFAQSRFEPLDYVVRSLNHMKLEGTQSHKGEIKTYHADGKTAHIRYECSVELKHDGDSNVAEDTGNGEGS